MMQFSYIANNTSADHFGDDAEFLTFASDTRKLERGDCFIAINGENFNGEDFVTGAIDNGACSLIVSQYYPQIDVPQLVCEDVICFLAELAKLKRSLTNAKVIAITGSCGKTSVKGLLAEVCKAAGSCSYTRGNFNNHLGVPFSILEADISADYWVLEAGTSGKGEIEFLMDIIQPNVSILNNIYGIHIEGFGSEDAIALEKSEIYCSVRSDFTAIVNRDLLTFECIAKAVEEKKSFYYQMQARSECTDLTDLVCLESVDLGTSGQARCVMSLPSGVIVNAKLSVMGARQVENALAATTAAYSMGIAPECIEHGLEAYRGEKGRMQLHVINNVNVIDDSYNAGPESMRAAIESLILWKNPSCSKVILVVGDMGELGPLAADKHMQVAEYAALKGVSKLYTVGAYAESYKKGFTGDFKAFSDRASLAQTLHKEFEMGLTILIKGSRSSRMDEVVKSLIEKANK